MFNNKSKTERDYRNWELWLAEVRRSTEAGVSIAETPDEKSERIQALCANYKRFFEYYFPHYCTDENGKISECADFHLEFADIIRKNPVINIAQQWGRGLAKSVHSNMGIPLWLWARGETLFEAVIGNNETAAKKLLDDVRAEFEGNQRILQDFGEQKLIGDWQDGDFRSKDGRFIAKALGMGQNVRGLRVGPRRPNYIVADDLEDAKTVKNPKRQQELAEWILRALIPTMIGDYRRFICANNYFAPQTIQSLLLKKRPKWKLHRVNAFDQVTYAPRWKQRDSAEKYKKVVEDIGVLAANSEFNNEPHIEGSIFLSEDFVYLKPTLYPSYSRFEMVIGFWDIAYGGTEASDFNSIVIAGIQKGKIYHLASYCRQSKMEPALEWLSYMVKKQSSRRMHLYYESQFWNDAVKSSIKSIEDKTGVSFNFIRHHQAKQSKYDRILTLQPYFQRREIYFRDSDVADPDTQKGIAQLCGIEPGYSGHDDWPDALESCVRLLRKQNNSNEWHDPVSGRGQRTNLSY